jgi:hypothetical protein
MGVGVPHDADEPTAPTGQHRLVDVAGIEISFRDVVLLWMKVLLGLPVALLITSPIWLVLAAMVFFALSVLGAALSG